VVQLPSPTRHQVLALKCRASSQQLLPIDARHEWMKFGFFLLECKFVGSQMYVVDLSIQSNGFISPISQHLQRRPLSSTSSPLYHTFETEIVCVMLPNQRRRGGRVVSSRMPLDRSIVRGSGYGPGVSLTSTNSDSHTNNLIQVPSNHHPSRGLALVEDLLESIVDSISSGTELTIPYRLKRSSQAAEPLMSSQATGGQQGVIRFPGRTTQEVTRFGRCWK